MIEALATDAHTPEEIAAETGITDRAARIIVSALADCGLLERVEGSYEPTDHTVRFVSKTDIRSIGSLPYDLDRSRGGSHCPRRWKPARCPTPTATGRETS